MRRIDLLFLTLASLCMVVGVAMGVAMGAAHDFRFAPVHAHLNLVGWTSLALFGLVYKAYPALAQSRLAAVQAALSAPSAVLFPLGIYVSIAHDQPGLAVAAALVWLAGAALFAGLLVRMCWFPLARRRLIPAE